MWELRMLLRLARKLAREPESLAPLLGRAPRLWDPQKQRAISTGLGSYAYTEALSVPF